MRNFNGYTAFAAPIDVEEWAVYITRPREDGSPYTDLLTRVTGEDGAAEIVRRWNACERAMAARPWQSEEVGETAEHTASADGATDGLLSVYCTGVFAALDRIAAWSRNWREQSRTQVRDSLRLIHAEAADQLERDAAKRQHIATRTPAAQTGQVGHG